MAGLERDIGFSRPVVLGDMISTALDTMADRWRMLEPHVKVFGPDDDLPRPAVILFHGCAGVRPHIETYAVRAAEAGYRQQREPEKKPYHGARWTTPWGHSALRKMAAGSRHFSNVQHSTFNVERSTVDPGGETRNRR